MQICDLRSSKKPHKSQFYRNYFDYYYNGETTKIITHSKKLRFYFAYSYLMKCINCDSSGGINDIPNLTYAQFYDFLDKVGHRTLSEADIVSW